MGTGPRTKGRKRDQDGGRRAFSSLLFIFSMLLFPLPIHAAEVDVCARVKLEVMQELSLERQAFDAHMRITNGFGHISLEGVRVDVTFTDETGNSVPAGTDPQSPDALFFIQVDSIAGVGAVDGTGIVQPSSSADIHWLIIPAPGSSQGNPQGKLYYVGAILRYYIGGEEHVTEVVPDHIFVKPLPRLVLDYFIPDQVYGDDAFTPEVEPPVPFTLGLRLKNNGAGTAREMRISSAGPKITENEQGLLIGFTIEQCIVNGSEAEKSLLADLGDIPPASTGIARWIMACTLSGRFVEFDADFCHSDELGGELTSLVEDTRAHLLVRDVLLDLPGRDRIRDFLARDGTVLRLYESEGTDTVVADQSASASLAGSGQEFTLQAPPTPGLMYVKLSDPFSGRKSVRHAVRSDGKNIKSENIWLSKARNQAGGWNYFIELFDAAGTGSYRITFEDPLPGNRPPILEHIPDQTAMEDRGISFVVAATDPDGTIPVLTAAGLPALAVFTDNEDGTGIFDWTPATGQAGTYEITFTASDGALKDTKKTVILVTTDDDTDSDGILDAWEMEHFGNLDRDGTGDFDLDGISDLEEFLGNTNPNSTNYAPGVPVVDYPQPGTEIDVLRPELAVINSIDPNGDTVSYIFEVYFDREMRTLAAISPPVPEAQDPENPDSTSWTIPVDLLDNTPYYWRVRATDGFGYSLWAYGGMFVNTANDPPGPFRAAGPADNSQVDTLTPVLSVTNSRDPDEDDLTYGFQVFSDSSLNTCVASVSGLPAGSGGHTDWTVDPPLEDNAWYYWKAVAVDEQGESAETLPAKFMVYTQDGAPEPPLILSPAPQEDVVVTDPVLIVQNSFDPEGDPVVYYFELDIVDTFDSHSKQESGPVAEGVATTSWSPGGLEENTFYYWRVKASDWPAESPWISSGFLVDIANEAPLSPTIRNPGANATVQTLHPPLQPNPSPDPEHDQVVYRLEIYGDPGLSDLLAQCETEFPYWTPPVKLTDGSWFYWRARAVDVYGLPGEWNPATAFFVKDDGRDEPPWISVVQPSSDTFTNKDSILIRWEDEDPDSNAEISLYYDTDGEGQDGTMITQALPEDLEGDGDQYVWDVTGIPDGAYHVYAVIADDESRVCSYGTGTVTLDRLPPAVSAEPPAGTYFSPLAVALSADEPADIYYSPDGNDPGPASDPYCSPIPVFGDTSIRVVAVDRAGNLSPVSSFNYTVLKLEIKVTVSTDKERHPAGIPVYAFTGTGSYTGHYSRTDGSGIALFNTWDLPVGSYRFRADYLGAQFWTDTITVPETLDLELVIPEQTAELTVTAASGPAVGTRVYVFSGTGAYLGISSVTDQEGRVSFELPVGQSFMFRADVLGGQYWSEPTVIAGGTANPVSLDAGGGTLELILEKGPGVSIPGVRTYLFRDTGIYVGVVLTTDTGGRVAFSVPEGVYKVRADYMGHQFWSDEIPVDADVRSTFSIPHQPVQVTAYALFQSVCDPIAAVPVYLFTPDGSYTGLKQVTVEDGTALFDLPAKPYRVRIDYLGGRFWSEDFTWQDVTVFVPMAKAEITVTGAGFPREGVKVYAFTPEDVYLGTFSTTDQDGKAAFLLPEGYYKFRVDYQGGQYWSGDSFLAADMVNPLVVSVGGGNFTLTILNQTSEPLPNIKCYVFNEPGAYLGLFGSTDQNGEVRFDLAEGTFKFRIDYLGSRFWTQAVSVPVAMALTEVIMHQEIAVTVLGAFGEDLRPLAGIRLYLFNPTGAYLGISVVTDENGRALLTLPEGTYQVRADYLSKKFWSQAFAWEDSTITIPEGVAQVQVIKRKKAVEGTRVHLFSEQGIYLGMSEITGPDGTAFFRLPEGTYWFRADARKKQYWTEADVPADAVTVVELDTAGGHGHGLRNRGRGLFLHQKHDLPKPFESGQHKHAGAGRNHGPGPDDPPGAHSGPEQKAHGGKGHSSDSGTDSDERSRPDRASDAPGRKAD